MGQQFGVIRRQCQQQLWLQLGLAVRVGSQCQQLGLAVRVGRQCQQLGLAVMHIVNWGKLGQVRVS